MHGAEDRRDEASRHAQLEQEISGETLANLQKKTAISEYSVATLQNLLGFLEQ